MSKKKQKRKRNTYQGFEVETGKVGEVEASLAGAKADERYAELDKQVEKLKGSGEVRAKVPEGADATRFRVTVAAHLRSRFGPTLTVLRSLDNTAILVRLRVKSATKAKAKKVEASKPKRKRKTKAKPPARAEVEAPTDAPISEAANKVE